MSTHAEQRAALAAELEAVETRVADLDAERARLAPKPDGSGMLAPSTDPRFAELLSEIPVQESHAETLKGEIARLDNIIAHEARLAGAVEEGLAARASWQVAEARTGDLGRQAANLRAKVDALRSQADSAEAEATQAEDLASREYARAVAAGDAKAEKAASASFQAVQDEADKAAVAARQRRGLVASMEAEIGELTSAAEAARSEAEAARRRMLAALSLRLQAEFDDAMGELLDLLARIAWAESEVGLSPRHWVAKLWSPRFAAGRGDFVGEREVNQRAAALSLADLLVDLDSLAGNGEEGGQ